MLCVILWILLLLCGRIDFRGLTFLHQDRFILFVINYSVLPDA